MVIDTFPFYNELDLLEIRLEELKNEVDLFVLVEAGETFSGKSKPLYFEQNKERFANYPVRQIVIPSYPPEMSKPWDREHGTRDILAEAMREMKLAPSDIIMVSDADEIPRASAVRECIERLRTASPGMFFALAQELSYYYVNCKSDEGWTGTRVIRWGDLKTSLTSLRYTDGTVIPDAGWHFSYVGGIESIQDKIGAAAHTEFDLPQIKDSAYLEVCLREAKDILGRDTHLTFVELDGSFPEHLVANRERFAKLIYSFSSEVAISPDYTAEGLYRRSVVTPSDINEHLPHLRELASRVEHVTEFGTRSGCSTSAFLCAKPKRMQAFDLYRDPVVDSLELAANEVGVDFTFHQTDVLKTEIEETDLLFIDTWHVEEQMAAELERHASKVRQFLVMHDTETFAHIGETAGHGGIWPAISDYMRRHPEWRLLEHFPNGNGLTVFARVSTGSGIDAGKDRPRVIDCFTFHNELELLEIRLNELVSVVDLFVLGESRYTFSGNEKPLYFKENAELFAKFPIAYVEIPFQPGGPWDREYFARDYMCAVGIPAGSPNDVILLSDVDEIPSAAGVRRACSILLNQQVEQVSWNQYLSYYYVNLRAGGPGWHGAVASKRSDFRGGQATRAMRGQGALIDDGWHFSYLGGSQRIRQKIESFCDVEFNDEKYKNIQHLDECLENGEDLFFRGDTYRYQVLDGSFPSYLLSNRERFAHLIKDAPDKQSVDGLVDQSSRMTRVNLGCGCTRYPGFVNVDLHPGPDVDLIGSAVSIPLPDMSVSVLYHNAVFEHVFLRQHSKAIQEATRVLAPDGVHIGLSIPDFRMVARLYLEKASGIVGPYFDLFNAYRYTHGEPEQCELGWESVHPTEPPGLWTAQLHKSLFDADYLHTLLQAWPHVVFRFRAKGEPHALNLGFIVSNGSLKIRDVLEACCPWVTQTVVEMDSIESIECPGRDLDLLSAVR